MCPSPKYVDHGSCDYIEPKICNCVGFIGALNCACTNCQKRLSECAFTNKDAFISKHVSVWRDDVYGTILPQLNENEIITYLLIDTSCRKS